MPSTYVYIIDRDFGFAPNPFHGMCTLATCKPQIRRGCKEGDWIVGMGGARLKATGRCVFAMRVDLTMTFNKYWEDPEYLVKRPARNGSAVMLLGDNIYHREQEHWVQAPSHHSNQDGTPNVSNLTTDTSADAAIVSKHFYYFGKNAIPIDEMILSDLAFVNRRAHYRFENTQAQNLLDHISSKGTLNRLMGDPHDFGSAAATYSAETNRITKG